MLLYFTVMATVNLCAGYALGVWLGSPFGADRHAHDDLPPLPKVVKPKKEKAKPAEVAKPQAAEFSVVEPEDAVEEVVARTETIAAETQSLAPANETPFDPLSSLANLEGLVDQLSELCGGATVDTPALMAAVRIDPVSDEANPELQRRLLDKLPELWEGEIDSEDLRHDPANGQLLCLFPGGRLDDVTNRMEQLRQLVEAAEFDLDGQTLQATVSCAIAESVEQKTPHEMLGMLDDAFRESDRLGVNRTYHHDGAFPTPLPPADVKVERRKVLV